MQNIDSILPHTWAKLAPVDLPLDSRSWILTKDSCTVGKAASNDIQIIDSRVDDVHYRIHKETQNANDCYWIENLSSTGIIVEDRIIEDRTKHKLTSGANIGFLSQSEITTQVILTHVFSLISNENEELERYQEEQKLAKGNEVHEKAKVFSDEHTNNIECSICLSLIYNCVTVLPCLHNFCASCISQWTLKSKVCPNCKQEYSDLTKNPRLNEMINRFLEMNPELKESNSFYDEKDRKDRIKVLFEVVTFSGGAIYEGERVNGEMNGKGKMTYVDGTIYEGEWVKGKKQGKGKTIYADGGIYKGEWINGKKQGRGKMTYADGAIYEGEWIKGIKQGKGKMIYPNGSVYEGDWGNDLIEGNGKMISLDGAIYEGEWINNKAGGKGKMIYADGTIYAGEWRNGKKEGKGKKTNADGTVYEGEWIDGKRHGKGKMIFGDGTIYEGDWANNAVEGKGKMIHSNGDVYEGGWANNLMEGQGKMIYTDGAIYEGKWRNGTKQEKEKMIDLNGFVPKGGRADNSMEGNGKMIYLNLKVNKQGLGTPQKSSLFSCFKCLPFKKSKRLKNYREEKYN